MVGFSNYCFAISKFNLIWVFSNFVYRWTCILKLELSLFNVNRNMWKSLTALTRQAYTCIVRPNICSGKFLDFKFFYRSMSFVWYTGGFIIQSVMHWVIDSLFTTISIGTGACSIISFHTTNNFVISCMKKLWNKCLHVVISDMEKK